VSAGEHYMAILFSRGALALRALGAILAVLASGGIPGAALKTIAFDLTLPSEPDTGRAHDAQVLVTVRAGGGGPPLSGAHVRAFSLLDDLAYLAASQETDKGGQALLVGIPRGVVWLIVDFPGRARGSTRFVADADRRSIPIELTPEQAIDVVTKDEGGLAIASAEVEVASSGDPLPVGARAGSDGLAHVTRLGAGPWRVTARAPSYEEASEFARQNGETVTVTLRKLGSFALHVIDAGGHPVAGARVAVAGATLWPPRAADTDATGDVRISGLAAGSYALRATRGDLVSPIELGVPLGRGEEKNVELKVARGYWAGVRVTDGDAGDAQGIAAARVTLAEGGISPFPIEATTDGKGGARLGPIAAGAATLSVRADGFVPRALALSDPPLAETRVALVRAGALMGRVVDERGYPVDGATIEIVGTDANGAPIFDDPRRASFQAAHFDAMLGGPAPLLPAGELGVMPGPVPPVPRSPALALGSGRRAQQVAEPWVTRSDGTFRAAPTSPGRVRAVARHPQYVEAESDSVTLAPGGEAHVEIVMHGGGSLEGRVVDARDRPVEGARVSVSAARGSLERATRTASDGTFAFAALPEAVSLVTSVDGDDQPDVHMAITIPDHGRREVTIHLPEPRGPLPVTVVDAADFPIPAAQLNASSLSADLPLRTTAFTDANGSASLKGARGLQLRIQASAPGHAPRVVTADGNGDALRIVLPPAESAKGEVVDARGGAGIASAEVILYTDLGVRRAHTDSRGTFTLNELAPGGARERVRAPGFAVTYVGMTIPDSGGRRPYSMPRVELTLEGVVEGEVVDTHGHPVAGARVAKDHAPTWLIAGASSEGVAVTDARGRFTLGELSDGTVTLEAYAPDLGRGRLEGVKVQSGRTNSGVRLVLGEEGSQEHRPAVPTASGSIAITLGETSEPVQVVVVSVVAGSEAERAGLAPGDVMLAVDEASVRTIEEAREKLGGALSDDVVIRVRRGDREMSVRVGREAVRR
jgi:protocatechuate 3,4-dioxygenase beta subunit